MVIQFAQSQIQIKLLVSQCCEQQNDSTLQPQQIFTVVKQYHAIEVLFSTSDNTPHTILRADKLKIYKIELFDLLLLQ